jgi:sugar phosphate isomerase/epimerase
MVEAMVDEFNFSICVDAGHQIKYGYDLINTFEKHKSKIPIIHLHGVDFSIPTGKDHTSLDKLPEKYASQIQFILKNFNGVVSLEVFNLENLNQSLEFLSKIFKDIKACL